MSFGGGFGSNTGGGFSGFGSNINNNTTSGGSLFGGNTATSGGFSGFGSNTASNNSPFGAPKPAFGAPATSTAGGLFGGGTSTTSGFGGTGFGAANNNNTTGGATLSTGFGGSSSNSLFGAKPATGFGATNNTGGSLFGGNTSGGFGSNNNTTTQANPFGGASSSTATGGFGAATTNSGFGGFGGAAASNTTLSGKSFEELRLEDYAQNRRLPQNNSFGSSSTFGGFGSSNNNQSAARPSLFGSTNNTTSTGFGANNTNTGFGAANTGFGANNTNTGSSLFGAKPATTSLFGNNTASTATTGGFGSNTGSSLFGANNNTASTNTTTGFGGFGSTNNNTNATGGLFGAANNNTQNKNAFGGFGGSNTATTNTGFGTAFGGNNATATPQASGGLFGAQPAAGGFGSNTGSSLFGGANNQAKPATGGLFGAPANNTTGGGLFGNTNNQSTGGFGNNTGGSSLFGGNQAATNTGSSLFGNNNQAKPAGTGLFGAAAPATGGSLFGAPNNTNAGGSLFGNNNTANAGGSLFGNNAAKPTGGSLFGGNAGGSSLFGGNTNNQAGNSLFGGNNNTAGNSLFGSAPNQNNSLFSSQGPQQNQLTASITGDPYGNAQLFASLAAPSPPVGPLATPLSGAKPAPRARASLLASVRGGSPMLGASTSLTPRGRPGYGFSYSNYNTPTANTPVLTPGASSLLRPTGSLGSTLSSRLSKSFSTSNLRGDNADGQSIVRTPAPGQGSQKKQVEAPKEPEKEPELRKRVSFDKSAEKESSPATPKASASNALVVRDDEPDKAPEMSQVNNASSLTTVPEEAAGDKAQTQTQSPRRPVEAGEYFTEPPLKQLKNMSRGQLSHLKSLTVGRQGVGKIEFGRSAEVDLSSVPLDDICGKIVQLKPRSATVYEDDSDKPPVGRDLNVPSTIYLEQSWPRSSRHSSATAHKSSDKEVERHKNRLRRVGGTQFLDYDDATGIWSFTVEHFTTYELDDEDETTMHDTTNMSDMQQADPGSASSNGVDAPPTGDLTHRSFDSDRSGLESPDLGDQDDTFQFKLEKRSQQGNLSLPGGFEDSMPNITYDHDEASADEMQEDDYVQPDRHIDTDMFDPFIETAGAVQPPSPDTLARYHQSVDEDDMEEEQALPGAFHDDGDGLKGILKQSTFNESLFGATENLVDLPWEDQLQRTLSPKKRDRQALRDAQNTNINKAETASDSLLKRSLLSRSQLGQSRQLSKATGLDTKEAPSKAFVTHMDIMKSLWADEARDLHWSQGLGQAPQAVTRSRKSNAETETIEQQFRNSFKPSFTNHTTLVFASTTAALKHSAKATFPIKPLLGNQRDITFWHAAVDEDLITPAFTEIQQNPENTIIEADDMDLDDGEEPSAPTALTSNRIMFSQMAASVKSTTEVSKHEKSIWELCSVLFDPLEVCAADLIEGMSDQLIDEFQARLRRDAFLAMWDKMLNECTKRQLRDARSSEEKAILLLTTGDVTAASQELMKAKNTKLAVLVSQLPNGSTNRSLITQQIESWQTQKMWSEFSDGQRALYSILAGKTCMVEGSHAKAAPEDKAASFHLSERFKLGWHQALSLRIRYSEFNGFPQAVEAFIKDVEAGVEPASTVSWHGQAATAVDTLLCLLMIITDQATPEALFDPVTVSGSASHNRIAWQLATLLGARGILQPSDEQMDALTVALASEWEQADRYLDAIWTLLHLNDNDARILAIKAVLERNSGKLPDPAAEGEHGDFETLTQQWSIPAHLVWFAKALHAAGTLKDPVRTCQCLLLAGTSTSYQEAHTILCNNIGPNAVIGKHYDTIFDLLPRFERAGTVHFDNWTTGGQIYLLLSQLLQLPTARSQSKEAETLLKKLDRALVALEAKGDRGTSLDMRVARNEIRKMVNERVKQMDDTERWYSGSAEGITRLNKGKAMLEKYMQALGEVH
ncbi:hypothetical protein AMS68_004234 [Peltaster fructicola]|uniref:Peptidase S59 domain-containing protein n=1 Tax=Peltaster fructicola TaxID=286661 RepID=A0A6H0XVD4_9PEZI|nr:hypothetical protein AMS68_004234 [Peltaster fructicola]